MPVTAVAILLGWCNLAVASDSIATAVKAYEQGHYQAAFSALMPHARAGDPEAQNYVGLMLSNGSGTQRDDKAAAYWFRQAANRGHDKAQRNLSYLIANGRATAKGQDLPEPGCPDE